MLMMRTRQFIARHAATFLAALVMVFSAGILVTWIIGRHALLGIAQNSTPPPPIAAVFFILMAAAVIISRHKGTGSTLIAVTLASITFAVALLQLVLWLSGMRTIAEILFSNMQATFHGIPIGRMSPVGMVNFIVLSCAFTLSLMNKRMRIIADIAALAVFVVSCIIMTGYWYDAPLFYTAGFIPVPFTSALLFMLFSAAMLYRTPASLFTKLLTEESVFSSIVRYMVPAITVTVLFTGWHDLTISAKMARQTGVIVNSGITLLAIALLVGISLIVSRRAGKKLQESEERLAATLRSIGDGVISTDAKGNVVALNTSAESMTGWTTAEAFGRPLAEVFTIINAQTRKPAFNPVIRVLAEGIVVGLANHTALIARDGTERQIADSAAPIRDVTGRIIGTVLVFRDVTEEYALRESMTRSEQQYRELFTEMRSAFAYHAIICDDAGNPIDYRFLAVNDAFERMTGLSRADIIGRTVKEVMPGIEQSWIDRYGEVALTGEAIQFENFAVPLGKHYDVRAYCPQHGTFATIFMDITYRKDLEAEQHRLTHILEESLNEIYVFRADTLTFEYVNSSALTNLGYTFADMHHMTPLDITPEFTRERFDALTATLLSGREQKVVFETIHRRANATTYPVEIHLQLVGKGEDARFLAMTYDITVRRSSEREREATIEILRLINSQSDKHSLIRAVTGYLKEWSGCEAVGIRLKDAEDYPYYETRGFPAEFVRAENFLCERDMHGQIKRDDIGNPILDCMCGNILQGRFDPTKPFFTARGSFWSNCTTKLLASTTEADRQARTRNRCNGEGYESVALIPLRYGNETLGLIQINDKRCDRFSESFISMLERMADSLAVALTQRNAERQLRESERMLQCLWKISQFKAKNVQEILDFTLTEAVALSSSTIGYIYHYSEERKEFTLNTWSREVMDECKVMDPQTIYKLEKTGIWGEVIRQRKPIIVNDFHEPNPLKKGYPKGHVHLETFMTVPVYSGERIIAVAGVANKKSGYTDADVRMLTHLMDSAWKIVERFEALESVHKHEAALMQDDRLKSLGVLATGIVHEINQPLMALSMAVDNLALKAGDASYAIVKTASMKEYVKRMAKIIDEVRTFAREKHDPSGEFSVNTAARNVLGMIGAQFKGHGICIVESFSENMPPVAGDLYRFEQVLLNLLTNAKQAIESVPSRTESEIRIATARIDGMVTVSVRDNGPGMSDEIKRNLFTPFYTTKPVGQGTGLGLSITYGIIKSMGGNIEAASEEGRYTEFTISLPVR